MLSSPSFSSAFVFSINLLTMSGFLFTSFYLAEASLPAFSWLETLVCVSFPKLFIMDHIFGIHFPINLFYLNNLKT